MRRTHRYTCLPAVARISNLALKGQTPILHPKKEAIVLAAIKRHAVISVAASVLRTELFGMKQDHGETVLAFSSRALGKARNCKFTVACAHGDPHDYCEDMVKHIILAGMHDEEIKRKVLSADSIDDKTLNETIALIEMEEMASRSMSDLSLSLPIRLGQPTSRDKFLPTTSVCKLRGNAWLAMVISSSTKSRNKTVRKTAFSRINFVNPAGRKDEMRGKRRLHSSPNPWVRLVPPLVQENFLSSAQRAQRTLNSFLFHHFVLRTMYAFPCLTIFSMALKVGCRDLLNPILLSV